jgi:hypothetical protein
VGEPAELALVCAGFFTVVGLGDVLPSLSLRAACGPPCRATLSIRPPALVRCVCVCGGELLKLLKKSVQCSLVTRHTHAEDKALCLDRVGTRVRGRTLAAYAYR